MFYLGYLQAPKPKIINLSDEVVERLSSPNESYPRQVHCDEKQAINNNINNQDSISQNQSNNVKDFYQEENQFDEYDFNQQFLEAQRQWDNSLATFFEDEVSKSEKSFEMYLNLREEAKFELNQQWEKTMEKNKLNDDGYYYGTTYEEDVKILSIRTKYHQRLKKMIGENAYNALQKKIRNYHAAQVKKARNGEYAGPHITF